MVELIFIWICGSIDPGIMKRNEDCIGTHEKTIKIVHKGVYKETKICLTCNITKPFRSHHCSDCDNCVIRLDHHCPWIGGCVGKRNYIYFFIFICLLNLKNIFICVFGIIHIIYIYKDVPNNEKESKNWVALKLVGLIPTLMTIISIGCIMSFIFGLMIYHIKLIINNITTKEEIKKLIFEKIGNPYDKGVKSNCKYFWTRHKTMINEYTVKELRTKMKKQTINNIKNNLKIKNNTGQKPKFVFSSLSKKEQQLKNKKKKVENDNNDSDKMSNNENKDIVDEFDNLSINDEKSEEIENDNKIFNLIKEKNKNKNKIKEKEKGFKDVIIKKSNKNKEKFNEKEKDVIIFKKRNTHLKNDNNKIKNKTDYTMPKKIEIDFSKDDISDENDNTNSKICNTSYKNKSNLDNNFIGRINGIELSQIKEKNLLNNLTKDEKGYQIAQKRLEELSSEITINQEKNCSISIPNENSFSDVLSQS